MWIQQMLQTLNVLGSLPEVCRLRNPLRDPQKLNLTTFS